MIPRLSHVDAEDESPACKEDHKRRCESNFVEMEEHSMTEPQWYQGFDPVEMVQISSKFVCDFLVKRRWMKTSEWGL